MNKRQIPLTQLIDQILCHFTVGQFDVAHTLSRELLSRQTSVATEFSWLELIADIVEIKLKRENCSTLENLTQKWNSLHLHALLSGNFSQWQRKMELAMQSHFGKIKGTPWVSAPLHLVNSGTIQFGKGVQLGYPYSAHFLSSYIYMNVRSTTGAICIGDSTTINNGAILISEWADGVGIDIGAKNLIGVNLKVYDSDFHGIDRKARSNTARSPVKIGDECFFGDNVTVLKGVTIGSGVTITGNSTVIDDIPDNVLAAGTPARVIRQLE